MQLYIGINDLLIAYYIWPKSASTVCLPVIRGLPKHTFKVFNNHFQECARNEQVHLSKTNVTVKHSF